MSSDPLGKSNRLVRNSLYGLLSWLLPILPTMVATPIVVGGLGKDQYGVLVVLLSFITYYFTNGIGRIVAKYIAEYRATGEHHKIASIISATILLGILVSLAGTAMTMLFARVIVTEILLIPGEFQVEAISGLYIACATILSITIGQIFQFALQGLQRFDKFMLLTNLNSVSFSVGSIILVLNGFGIISLLYWNLFTTIAVGCFSFVLATRSLPEFRFRFRLDAQSWRAVLHYAGGIMAYQVCGSILLLFERAWLMRNFGPEELTYYAVPMALGMYLHLFVASLVIAMFPMMNELLTDREKLVALYQKSTKLVLAIVTFALVSAIIGGRMFLRLWLDNDFAKQSYSLLVIHFATFAILALSTIAWQVAESFRKAALNALSTFLWMSAGIVLMVVLSGPWLINGVGMARLIGVLVFFPLIFYVEIRFLGGFYWRFWGSMSVRIAFAAALTAIAEILVTLVLTASWLTLGLTALAGAISFLAGLMLSGFFDDSERRLIGNLMARRG